jgi:hypothetical protein
MLSTLLRRSSAMLLSALAVCAAQPCLSPDVWCSHLAADPQVAPDGKSIIYVHTRNDVIDDLSYSNLRQVSIDGGRDRTVTEGKYYDASPVGLPMAHTSPTYPAAVARREPCAWGRNGRGTLLAIGAQGLSNIAWSPNGGQIAFTAFVRSQPVWAPAMPPRPAGARLGAPPAAITNPCWTFDGLGVLEPGTQCILLAPVNGGGTPDLA